jgi:hypothetical protein
MLALALGFIFSGLAMLCGAGLIGYALLMRPVGWAGIIGGGVGVFLGGAGGLFGVYNHYRQYQGAANIMQAPHWTGFDSAMLVYGLAGLAMLAAGVLLWGSADYEVTLLLCLLGGLAAMQGAGTAVWRWSIRQSQRPRSATAIDPRLYVVAGVLILCGLLMAAGLAMAVIAVWKIPIGSSGFWGWMGGACGCFFGGGGGLLGTWNSYRQMEGHADMMADPGRNLFDRCVLAILCIGIALLVAAASVSPWASSDMVSGGLLLGSILTFQGLLFLIIRSLIRRGIRQQTAVSQGHAD